jgi:multidrug efflux pump subunit AcrB
MQKRSFAILMSFGLLTLAGLALLPRLSVQLNPSQGQHTLTVSYAMPSASPEIIERLVTAKLEGAFSTLQGITKVSSVSQYHSGYITLSIDKKADISQLRFEVAMLIRQLYPSLPSELSYPTIRLHTPDQADKYKPLMTLQFNGNASQSTLQIYAEEQIKPKLAQIEGIYEINVTGGNRQEWVLRYQTEQLAYLGLQEGDIVQAVKQHFQQQNLGVALQADGSRLGVVLNPNLPPPQSFPVGEGLKNDTSSSDGGAEIWNSIPLKKVGERIIYLTDLVSISKEEQPITSFYRINGKNAVNLTLTANSKANQLSLAKEIKAALTQLNRQLPPTYHIRIDYDATEYIQENLNKIGIQSGLAVLILVLFVLLTTRNFAYTALIVVGTVANLALAFILFYFFKVEIHLYSLAALTTCLGMIMDNMIVMIDHYRRYKNLHVFTALLGATLTTIAGLSVIYFLPEENRIDLIDFALVMVITLGVSLAVALFFIPAAIEKGFLSPAKASLQRKPSLFQRKKRRVVLFTKVYASILRFLFRFRKIALIFIILLFGLPVFFLPNKIEGESFWAKAYNQTLGSEYYIESIQPYINKFLGGTLRLFVYYTYEKSYYAKPERTALYLIAGLPNQSTLAQMNDIMLKFEHYLAQFAEIDRFITNVQSGQQASIVVYFKPEYDKGAFPYILKNRCIALSTEMSGVSWDIFGVGQGFSQNAEENSTPTFNVQLWGYNYNELERQALILKKKLEAHPRIQEVNINKSPNWWGNKNLYEYIFDVNYQKLVVQNLDNTQSYSLLEKQNALPRPDFYQLLAGEYIPIKVIPSEVSKFDIWQLKNQAFQVISQKQDSTIVSPAKFADIAEVKKEKVISEIHKENQQYLRMISFEYFGSANFGEKFLDEKLKEMEAIFPLGYSAKKMSYRWYFENAKKQYGLIGLVLLLVYIICAITFESLWQPFALILLIPFSFIGVFATFYLFDFNFDQGGYASFILLSGIVVNAGIFIIAEFNHLQKLSPQHTNLKLYLRAYNHKIMPIILTTLSTIVGFIPFLIYGQNEAFWFALATGTIGGLLMSILVIFFYLPLIFLSKYAVSKCKTSAIKN